MITYHREDILLLVRGLTAPLIFISPFVFGLYEGYEIIIVLIIWMFLNDINHLLHLHVHLPFTKNAFLNLMLDLCMGITTGMTAYNWRIQHKYRHHVPHKKDFGEGYAWEIKKFTILGSIVYSFRTIFPIIFLPIVESFKKGILKNEKEPVNYRVAFFEQFIPFIVFGLFFMWNQKLALYYILPWYFLVHFVTRYIDYLNHFDTGEGKYSHSNNSLHHGYNKLGNNFGYHTAHHLYPSAHWTTLPNLHKEIEDNINPKYLKTYTWSGFAIFWHYVLSLKSKM
ncbi:fatty acid desaturase [Kordia sp.]|uniref:fatty acid desaturase n=1 Tax=Kordia sp. TaxID=1965332 RepID=UPI003D290232